MPAAAARPLLIRPALLLVAIALMLPAEAAPAAESQLDKTVAKGLAFLRDTAQGADGKISPRMGSGITSLAVTAALRHGVGLDDPLVSRGLEAIEGYVQPDGGVYGTPRLKNYETCVAIVALAEANRRAGDGRYDQTLANADAYVRGLQIGADGETDPSDPHYGGVGYSGKERPDLSNTAYLLEALVAMGAQDSDPAIQRALAFVGRCQNLDPRKHGLEDVGAVGNDTKYGPLVDDGGFYYVVPTEDLDDSDRTTPNGGLRSYGSMSYSGFKSLVYAGLSKDDPRAKAALDWIRHNYTLEQNPGQGAAGLFYYYNTFGSALGASDLTKIRTADAGERDWRTDLTHHLSATQRADGSWVNTNRQWFENDPNLCTAFALMALSYCQPN